MLKVIKVGHGLRGLTMTRCDFVMVQSNVTGVNNVIEYTRYCRVVNFC